MPSELPFLLSFITESNVAYVFYILMRITGLFVISPLFSNKAIATYIRLFLAIFTTIIIAIVLYPQYHGIEAVYTLPAIHYAEGKDFIYIMLMSIKELAVGYIIGFCFNIIFESMLMTGELIDSMIGFSAAQFLDPFSNTFQSMLGQLLVLTGAIVMLIFDLHHLFIRIVTESFSFIPLGDFHMNEGVIDHLTLGMGILFLYAVKIGAISIVILACGLVGIAFTIRVVPEMNILLTGLPMRVMIGFYTIMLGINHIVPIFQEGFMALSNLIQSLIYRMGNA